MDCAACHSPLPEGVLFCPRCGAKAPDLPSAEPEDPIRAALRKALGQQYEIKRLLGKGGMGAVYLATEAALEREVAIKVLPPDRGATKDSRDRFRREARTAAKLSHPNIVPLYTFGDVDGTLYFVMGYVKGESLAARLKREGRLSVEDARRLLIEIAEALDYAHKLGIIHRDIKPDNVLIEEGTGRAMLMDFGVAKAMGAGQTMTELGGVLGTPQYMSPEQAQGKADIDHRSDLYSLGVMGYAMLAGRLPFEGPTPGDIMVQHITKEAPTLKSLAPEIPVEIATALTRCLAKDPGKRWPDANALKGALSVTGGDDEDILIPALGSLRRLTQISYLLLPLSMYVWLNGWLMALPPPALFGRILPAAFATFLVLTSFGILASAASLRHQGYGWRDIGFVALCRPSWWPLYYPRRFRPRHDVWERLPRDERRCRECLTWAFIAVFLILPSIMLVQFHGAAGPGDGHTPAIAALAFMKQYGLIVPLFSVPMFLFAISAWFDIRNRRTLRAKGVPGSLAALQGLRNSADRAFWSRPEFAALLLPAGEVSVRGRAAPTSARDLASAISTAVSGLTGESHDLGLSARDAALNLAGAIGVMDGEIASLEGSADPAEAERLAAKITALGPASASEGEGKGQMRDLFQKQLDLLRGFESRLEGLKARRARQLELLRALWRQAVDLKTAMDDPGKNRGATDRIRTLCAEIARQVDRSSATRQFDPAITDSPTIERT